MPFIGSINEKLRKFFWTHAGVLDGRKCYIGCSGNFTIEQILTQRCNSVEIYSNDVSLYTSVLGHVLAAKPFEINIINPELEWANVYIKKGPVEMVSMLLILLEMLKFEKQKNPYQERMWQSYLIQIEKLLEKTSSKVSKALQNIRIHDYTMIDVFDYYPKYDGISIGFLPTYVGGYEKLFEKLESSVEWKRPHYEILTTERREETIQKMTEGEYIVYDDQKRDLPCVAQVELFGRRTVYIYSNIAFQKGVFRRKINEKIYSYKILMPDEEISAESTVILKEADLPAINHYRNMYLSKKIEPGSGGPCYLVFAGEKLFGFLIFQAYSKRGGPDDEIYLLSDFVVPSKRHKRLAKLLLMAIRCKEVKAILNEKLIRNYKTILTTAFTDQPVSMKYRGVFELVKRGDGFLNYKAEFNENSLCEVIRLWKKKYEKQSASSMCS